MNEPTNYPTHQPSNQVVGSLGLSCVFEVNYIGAMVVTTITPIVIAALIWLKYIVLTCLDRVCSFESQTKRLASHMNTFLVLTYLIFIGASSKVLHFFKCHEFDLPDGGTESYLYRDYSVDCNGSEYKKYVVFARIMVIIYPIGIPLLCVLAAPSFESLCFADYDFCSIFTGTSFSSESSATTSVTRHWQQTRMAAESLVTLPS